MSGAFTDGFALIPARLAVTVVASLAAGAPAPCRAAGKDPADQRHFEQIRVGLSTSIVSGTKPAGDGARAHYRGGTLAFESVIEVLVAPRVAVGVGLHAGPAFSNDVTIGPFVVERDPDPETGLLYGRIEGALQVGIARWERALPGSVTAGAWIGADTQRYWYAEHSRLYGAAFARLRLFPWRDVSLETQYVLSPWALATQAHSLIDHRFELSIGWEALLWGARIGVTRATAGSPSQDFVQHEVGLFLGARMR